MKRVFICISAALAVISSEVQSGAKAPGETCAAADSAYVEVLPFHFLTGDGRDVRSLGERQGMVEWDISLYGYGAKDGMPFWGTANRRGLFPSNLQTGGNRQPLRSHRLNDGRCPDGISHQARHSTFGRCVAGRLLHYLRTVARNSRQTVFRGQLEKAASGYRNERQGAG